MFIPQGKALHENLATSYVLVDALVEDLCEGGFSGVVEVVLRDKDGHIFIEGGRVAAVIEGRINKDGSATGHYSLSTVVQIATQARVERGRVGVYSYPPTVAATLGGRALAEPLYTRLSTDFADLEKMLSKLWQERDREWFIEITAAGRDAILLHSDNEYCRIIRMDRELPDVEIAQIAPVRSPAIHELIDECNLAGSTFDVYFKRPAEAEPLPPAHSGEPYKDQTSGGALPIERQETREEAGSFTAPVIAPPPATGAKAGALIEELSLAEEGATEAGDKEGLREAETMIEIKRLMGEIIRTIEDAVRAIEPRDLFSIYLRAGQLKIADRYPFLDPFGAEFEYLGGEIAFIGKATPGEFTAGLTEALKLAVIGVSQSSTQPGRMRGQIAAELIHLSRRLGADLEPLGLGHVIEAILKD